MFFTLAVGKCPVGKLYTDRFWLLPHRIASVNDVRPPHELLAVGASKLLCNPPSFALKRALYTTLQSRHVEA